MSSSGWLLLLGPVVAVGAMSALLQTALKSSQIRWLRILVAFIILGITGAYVAYLSSTDVAGGTVALLSLLLVAMAVVGMSIWMVISLSGLRKFTAIGMAIGIPLVLFLAWDRGATYTPEEKTMRNGNLIVAALATYHQRNSSYPATLAELGE